MARLTTKKKKSPVFNNNRNVTPNTRAREYRAKLTTIIYYYIIYCICGPRRTSYMYNNNITIHIIIIINIVREPQRVILEQTCGRPQVGPTRRFDAVVVWYNIVTLPRSLSSRGRILNKYNIITRERMKYEREKPSSHGAE